MTESQSSPGSRGWVVVLAVVGAGALGGWWLSQERAPAPPPAPAPAPPPAPFGNWGLQGQGVLPPGARPPSPRDTADGLFNVAMAAAEQGDQATVAQAVPQALAAYRQLAALDDDGVFHVALLELTGGQFAQARATAQKLLSTNANHLLALSVSARAAAGAGDTAAAQDFNQRLLRAYDGEVNRPLPEYHDHARVLPLQKVEAEAALKP